MVDGQADAPPPYDYDVGLIRLVRELAVESDEFVEQFGARHDLHRTDMNALVAVMDAERDGEPMSPSRLAAVLGLSASATTALLDRLERNGYLKRDRSGDDRRRVGFVVPDKTLRLGREFFAPLGAEFGEAWSRFTPRQRDTIAEFLRSSIAAMRAVRETWPKA